MCEQSFFETIFENDENFAFISLLIIGGPGLAFSITGMMGNSVLLIILDKIKPKHLAHVYIKWLCYGDFLTCFVLLFNPIFFHYMMYFKLTIRYNYYYNYFQTYVINVALFFITRFCGFIILLMAFDRFIAIKYPLKYKGWITLKRIYLAISVCFSISAIFAICHANRFHIVEICHLNNESISTSTPTESRYHGILITRVRKELFCFALLGEILTVYIPALLHLYLNIQTVLHFKRYMNNKFYLLVKDRFLLSTKTMLNHRTRNLAEEILKKENKRIFNLILVIICVYLLCSAPMSILFLVISVQNVSYSKFNSYLIIIFQLVATLDNSFNFLICFWADKKIKILFYQTLSEFYINIMIYLKSHLIKKLYTVN
ncbi:unnamed protein product [Gordionus sp. m RMFG-2023]